LHSKLLELTYGSTEHGTLALAPLTALRSLTIKDFQNDDGFGFLPPSPSSGRTFASLLESAASPTLSRAEWHVGEAAVAVVERAEWAMVKEAVDVARRKLDKAGKMDLGMSSGAGASFKPRMEDQDWRTDGLDRCKGGGGCSWLVQPTYGERIQVGGAPA
jgi:hypothetical protein